MSESSSLLNELRITSIGVIESAQLEFGPGLNVLTGETGAGKTMVLTALSLLTGGKSDSSLIRTGADRLQASARFQLTNNERLFELINDLDIAVDENELLMVRTVTNEGKSRAVVGSSATTVSNLSAIADFLIEIHGQSASQKLFKTSFQREMLDKYAGIEFSKALSSYQNQFAIVKNLAAQVSDLKKALAAGERELAELLEFQSVMTKLRLGSNELLEIENEISKLDAVEIIRVNASLALELLTNDEQNVINSLVSGQKGMEIVRGKDRALDEITDKLFEIIIQLQDVGSALNGYLTALDADPNRLAFLQERKSAINNLIKKFGEDDDREVAYDSLLEKFETVTRQIENVKGGDARVIELTVERDTAFSKLRDIAEELTRLRKAAAQEFAQEVLGEIAELAMPNAKFSINFLEKPAAKFSDYSEYGCDEIEMVFASHSSTSLLPISKAASGGELSRLMLGMEVVIAKTSPVGTYIFDEVDSGIGGKVALEVGRRLAKLAKSSQVIVVTHLAQVAAWADHHFVVTKSETGTVTESDVMKVVDHEREVEIARMLAGQSDSKIAQQHAQELLTQIRK